MAVTIRQCNKPTKEQLAASVILAGASALRMIRAERRQMGYIGWKDLEPEEERRVLCTSSPSAEDIYLSDLVRIGAKISLSDRGKYLPPYTSPVANRLAKDKDQPADVGYFEVEPVLTPDRLADYLAACKGNVAKQLLRLCPYLSENLRSPMECIMLALFSLPFSYGGFACGPFKTDYKIEFDDRAQAISGMPHAVCDAYQEAARFDLEYNGELGHSSRRGRIHDENATRALLPWESRSRQSTTRCSATWKRWKPSHGASTSACESGTGIVLMPAGRNKRRCLTRCGRVLGLSRSNSHRKKGRG